MAGRRAAVFREMRLMDEGMLEQRLENIDRRLDRVEQILPTLATKHDLEALASKDELAAAVAPLATKDELSATIASLATKQDLREEGERLRRHMDLLTESLRDDIQLIAARVASATRSEPSLNDQKSPSLDTPASVVYFAGAGVASGLPFSTM
jgi:hypothetical protein